MLNIENVSLSYSDNKKVLNDVSLSIEQGECILFTGKSGSGKSSLINVINGLAFKHDNASIEGRVIIDGKATDGLELYEISMMISSVFQNPKTHFFNVDTTIELLFYLENMGFSREEMDARMENMLKVFPIRHLLGRNIFELSGGEKQVLCVAACYISGCKIIVLDEPSSNLDEKYIDILRNMLEILKDKGITIIVAEHRIYYLMSVVDRIVLLKNGKPEKIFTRAEFLGLSEAELLTHGLRSPVKTALKTPLLRINRDQGQELLIKKMSCPFSDGSVLALENISFSLGKIYGIVGRNGVGKSTFLRALTGLAEKEKNEILFNNARLRRRDRLKLSSLVMQDVNHQLFTASVLEELNLGIKNLSRVKVDNILAGLALTELAERHPMSLSGGEKQRVAIASVLCKNSSFIFFDEPTSGMDYDNMLKISCLIKGMRRADNIIFIVSHDNEFLNETTDENFSLEDCKKYGS